MERIRNALAGEFCFPPQNARRPSCGWPSFRYPLRLEWCHAGWGSCKMWLVRSGEVVGEGGWCSWGQSLAHVAEWPCRGGRFIITLDHHTVHG